GDPLRFALGRSVARAPRARWLRRRSGASRVTGDDELREAALFVPVPERVGHVDRCARRREPPPQTFENRSLAGRARDEMTRVNRPALTDAIDAADALLEPHRIPRQFKIDDETAHALEVQPLARGV